MVAVAAKRTAPGGGGLAVPLLATEDIAVRNRKRNKSPIEETMENRKTYIEGEEKNWERRGGERRRKRDEERRAEMVLTSAIGGHFSCLVYVRENSRRVCEALLQPLMLRGK